MSKRRLFIATGIIAMVLLAGGSVFAGGKAEQGAGSSGPVTLQYVFWGDQNEVNATKELTDSYMAKNPNVNITLLHIPQSNTYMDKINTLAPVTVCLISDTSRRQMFFSGE